MLKHSLKEAVSVRDAQTKELCAARDRLSTLLVEKESRNATTQTATDKQRFDLERKLKRSIADLQLATADLAYSKEQATKLRQELVESTARTTVAKNEARRNEELVSAKQEEIIGISQREQVRHTLRSPWNLCWYARWLHAPLSRCFQLNNIQIVNCGNRGPFCARVPLR